MSAASNPAPNNVPHLKLFAILAQIQNRLTQAIAVDTSQNQQRQQLRSAVKLLSEAQQLLQ
jgi:hypothetical protein